MEVVVSNVSMVYCPESLIRDLFSQLGTVIHSDYTQAPSLYKSANDHVCFLNHSEAIRALCLDGIELGDRKISVKLSDASAYFDAEKTSDDFLLNESMALEAKTLLLKCPVDWAESTIIDVLRIQSNNNNNNNENNLISRISPGLFLIEFPNRPAMKEGLLRWRTRAASNPAEGLQGGEAWKFINKDRLGGRKRSEISNGTGVVKERLIYGVPESKLLASSTTKAGKQPEEGRERRDTMRDNERQRLDYGHGDRDRNATSHDRDRDYNDRGDERRHRRDNHYDPHDRECERREHSYREYDRDRHSHSYRSEHYHRDHRRDQDDRHRQRSPDRYKEYDDRVRDKRYRTRSPARHYPR